MADFHDSVLQVLDKGPTRLVTLQANFLMKISFPLRLIANEVKKLKSGSNLLFFFIYIYQGRIFWH